MPIRSDLRPFYRTLQYKQAVQALIERSKNRCESCDKPNGERILTRTGGGHMIWRPHSSLTWRNESGWPVGLHELHEVLSSVGLIREIKVVLTTAHLNHVAGDDRLENLRYWCQWHHLIHDRGHHKLTRSLHKDERRPLLTASAAESSLNSPLPPTL